MSDIVKTKQNALTIQDALFSIVTNKDIDPERLERFIDLQIKVEEIQAKKDYYNAISSFQSECPIIKRTKKVDFASSSGGRVKYDYAPYDEIAFIIKPITSKYGLGYSFDVEIISEKEHKLITIIKHKNGYSEKSYYYYDPIHDDKRMNLSQRRKSALSFAKRSGLENALGIATTNDDDDARRAIDTMASEDEISTILSLSKKTNTDVVKITDFLGVESIENISKFDAERAINLLKTKLIKVKK